MLLFVKYLMSFNCVWRTCRGARERIYGPPLHNLQSGDQHTTIENGSPNPDERVRSKATQCETKISANQVTEESDAKR